MIIYAICYLLMGLIFSLYLKYRTANIVRFKGILMLVLFWPLALYILYDIYNTCKAQIGKDTLSFIEFIKRGY
jgi:hypothetical protein